MPWCVCLCEHRDVLKDEVAEKKAEIDQEREAKQEAMDERYVCIHAD